jgi:hypothetical protein
LLTRKLSVLSLSFFVRRFVSHEGFLDTHDLVTPGAPAVCRRAGCHTGFQCATWRTESTDVDGAAAACALYARARGAALRCSAVRKPPRQLRVSAATRLLNGPVATHLTAAEKLVTGGDRPNCLQPAIPTPIKPSGGGGGRNRGALFG